MNKNFLLQLLVLLVLCSCVSRYYSQKLLDKSKNAIETKDMKSAVILLNKALKANSKLSEAYYLRGNIYENQGKYEEAVKDYINAFNNSNNQIKEGLAAGKLLYELHRYKESFLFLSKTYEIDSTNQQTIYFLMLAYSAIGQADNALLLFDRHTNYSKNPKLAYAKAVASDSLGMTDYAGIFYRNYIEEDKTNPEAYLSYAKLLMRSGNEQAAMHIISEGIELFNDPDLIKIRMIYFASKYLWHDAISDATTLYNLTHNIEFLERRARYYRFVGLLNNARNDYDYILTFDDNKIDALFNRALVNHRLNNENEVFADLNSFLKLVTPETPQWQINRAKEIIALFEKETAPTILTITSPTLYLNSYMGVKQKEDSIKIIGNYNDETSLATLSINGINALNNQNSDFKIFEAIVPFPANDTICITATDIYENLMETTYRIIKYDSIAPEIVLLKPRIDSLESTLVEYGTKDINIKLLVADDSYVNSIHINNIQHYKGLDKRTVYIDTIIVIPANNKITIEVIDVFGNKAIKQFIITNSEINEKPNSILKDILVLSFERSLNSDNKTDSLCINFTDFFKNFSNTDIKTIKSTTKKSLEQLLLFDLNKLIDDKKYKNIVLYFDGKGTTYKNGHYWITSDSDITNKSTWFNISFLSSINKNLNIDGTVAIITTDVEVPERRFDENIDHIVYTFTQYSDSLGTEPIPNIYSLIEDVKKIDFIQLLDQLSKNYPEKFSGKWNSNKNIYNFKPMILYFDKH